MRLFTTNGTLREQFEERRRVYEQVFGRVGAFVTEFADAHAWAVFACVTAFCFWLRMGGFPFRRLDHDELFTFYIAQAPSLGKLLALTQTVDLHPPLSYLFVRLSFALFGAHTWSCRLPSVIAFVTATGLLYWLVQRMLSPLYALIAVLLLWSGPYSYSAAVARPYSWLLCFTCLMMVSWWQATENVGERTWALLEIVLGGFGLLLSHVLGVFPFFAIVAAELVRLWTVRKPDWRLAAALLIPGISVLSYLPLVKNGSILLFTPDYRVTPVRLLCSYWEPLRYVGTALLLIAVLGLLCVSGRQQKDESSQGPKLNRPFVFLLAALFLVPLGIGTLFARTGTPFFDRYGVVMLIPAAMAPAMFLAYRTRCDRRAGTAVVGLLVILLYLNTAGRIWFLEHLSSLPWPRIAGKLLCLTALPTVFEMPKLPPVPAYLERSALVAAPVEHLNALRPDLPLVAGSAVTFLELDHYEGADLGKRLFLLTDKEAAATFAHETLFETYEQLQSVFPLRGTVTPYCSFIRANPHFLVLGGYNYPHGWLLRKVETDGARLAIIGKYGNTLEEHDIYEVTVTANPCAF